MKAPNRIVAASVAVASVVVAVMPGFAQAQQRFPAKPVRIIVPVPAGGVPDMLARIIGPKMSERWGQPVVVENRPGGSGIIANSLVAKAVPDGHTLLLTAGTFVVNAARSSKLPYDSLKDFAGVSQVSYGTAVLVVPPSLGVKSVPELIALAKAKPGKLFFASNGIGSGPYVQGEQFRLAAGVNVGHVAYAGTSQSLIETATGRAHFYVSTVAAALPFINDGKLLALAVFNSPRSPLVPDVPVLADTLPGIPRVSTQGMLAPAGTPRPVLNQISRELARILNLPDVKEQLDQRGFVPAPTTPEEFDRIVREQIETLSGFFKAAGIKPE